MSLDWPTNFANTLNFFAKQIWCLRIYEECLKILILGKLGLKLVFLKNFASYTHAFYSYFSMLGGFYAKTWLFFQNCAFSGISINRGCFSINRNWFKFFGEPLSVSINWKSYETFFKTRFLDESNTFSKSFLTFLSPYDSVKAHLPFFVVFIHSFCKVFLSQGRYVRFTLPFAFYVMFSCINSCFLGKFSNLCKFRIFVDSSQNFWNWSMGFCYWMLWTWSWCFNLINLVNFEKLKFLGLVCIRIGDFVQLGPNW